MDIIWIIPHNFATYSNICYILSPIEKAANLPSCQWYTLNLSLFILFRLFLQGLILLFVLRLRDIHFITSIKMRVVCNTDNHLTATNFSYSAEYNVVIFKSPFLTFVCNGTYFISFYIQRHINMCEGVELWFYYFLNWALDKVEWSATRFSFIPSGNSTRISCFESKIRSRQIVLVV